MFKKKKSTDSDVTITHRIVLRLTGVNNIKKHIYISNEIKKPMLILMIILSDCKSVPEVCESTKLSVWAYRVLKSFAKSGTNRDAYFDITVGRIVCNGWTSRSWPTPLTNPNFGCGPSSRACLEVWFSQNETRCSATQKIKNLY